MSVDFDPVRLGRRRRRVDPVAVGTVVVIAALIVAVAKPWGGDDGPTALTAGSASPAAGSLVPGPTISPAPPTPGPTPIQALQPPSWIEMAGVVMSHDAWGVHAVLSEGRVGLYPGSPGGYSDRWRAATLDDRGQGSAILERDERAMVGLGVTIPNRVAALAGRVWRLHEGDRLEWVDTVEIAPNSANLGFLFLRPGHDGQPYTGWEPGTYRIDVLTSRGIRSIDVGIPGRFGDVPRPEPWPSAASGLVPASATDASAIRGGMFATVDGSTVALGAAESSPLSDAEAWFDTVRQTSPVVATAYLPRATGVGVMLGPGDDITGSTIRRLSPDGPFDPLQPIQGLSDRQGRMLFVLYPAPDGAWEPGTYAITVDWMNATGTHEGTWHVELRPGSG